MRQFVSSIATTNVAQNVTTSGDNSYSFNSAVFWGYSGFAANGLPVNNVSGINLGLSNSQLPIYLAPSGSFTWTVPEHQRESISNFWLYGNSKDGVVVTIY